MKIAREIVRRYPAVRSSWPVAQARAWREQRSYRQHPRRMAAWYRDMPDLRTRLCVSNLVMPEAPHLCQKASVRVSLLDEHGAQVSNARITLDRDQSTIMDLGSLLPAGRRGRLASGQVWVDFEGPNLGSSRAYFHWFNERSLTSSHEKFGKSIPAVGGYWTVPNVAHHETYRMRLALVNLDERYYESEVTLKDADGRSIQANVALPPNGSRFVRMEDLFEDAAGFLGDQPGILYFGNYHQPAMYYYFIENERLGTWRGQHL